MWLTEKSNNLAWGDDLILAPSLMGKPEKHAKHRLNQQIEQKGLKSIKHTVLKRYNYLTISEEPIEVQIGKMKSNQTNQRIQ